MTGAADTSFPGIQTEMPGKRKALWAAPVKRQQQPKILWKLLEAKSCLHNKHLLLVHPGKIPTQNPPAMFLWTKPPAIRLNFTQQPKPWLPSWFQFIEHKVFQPCSAPQMSQEGWGEALVCWQGQKEGCCYPPRPSGCRKLCHTCSLLPRLPARAHPSCAAPAPPVALLAPAKLPGWRAEL